MKTPRTIASLSFFLGTVLFTCGIEPVFDADCGWIIPSLGYWAPGEEPIIGGFGCEPGPPIPAPPDDTPENLRPIAGASIRRAEWPLPNATVVHVYASEDLITWTLFTSMVHPQGLGNHRWTFEPLPRVNLFFKFIIPADAPPPANESPYPF
jgi:hypothetical protein